MVLPAVHIRTDLFHLVEVETDDLILQVEHGMVQETVKEQALYNFDTTICYDKPLQEMYEWMDAADEPEPEPLPGKSVGIRFENSVDGRTGHGRLYHSHT